MAAAKLSVKVTDDTVYYSHKHYVSNFRFVDEKPKSIDSIVWNSVRRRVKRQAICFCFAATENN